MGQKLDYKLIDITFGGFFNKIHDVFNTNFMNDAKFINKFKNFTVISIRYAWVFSLDFNVTNLNP